MTAIKDWNGNDVPVRRSAGPGQVLTFERWEDNVLRGHASPWPPSDLLKQVTGYRASDSHFAQEDAAALKADLGLISRFQSVNSEDAVTWSWFGTLDAAPAPDRRAAIQWLYDRAGIPATAVDPRIDQWMRVFHPNAPGSPRGPELDARITDDTAVVYVEAKWKASIGTGKGKDLKIPDDQIELRRDSLRDDPALLDDDRALAVLGVSEVKPDLAKWTNAEADQDVKPVTIAWLTWDDLAECGAHPLADEFALYLAWKRKNAGP